jgi:(1->4)-alpha-D-glucan 1-alpha-D-glucosylmutase
VTRGPTSTYRLQLHGEFDLDDARALVPYLAELGVDWLYLSPVFAARPGSRHGYDVIDPTVINPELGGREGLERLAATAHAAELRILLDIVPNHEAVTTRNPRWFAVLQHGSDAGVAAWFDIDWSGNDAVEPDKVLWPLLRRDVPDEVADGTLHVETSPEGAARLRYDDETLPIAGDAREPLEVLLDRQHYRLAQWRTGSTFLNYRRFFDVSDLVGIRVEAPEVFAESHALVIELLNQGVIDGLRVDHVDGLANPTEYLRRLSDVTNGAFVVVEKILGADEELSPEWPVAGTTGYETADDLTAVLIDPEGRQQLERALLADTGGTDFATIERAARRQVLRDFFIPEWGRVTRALAPTIAAARIDTPVDVLARALAEITISLPVYRTYCADEPATGADLAHLDHAVSLARSGARPDMDAEAFEAVGRILTGAALPPEARPARARLMTLWQQLTGAVMAKGREDTACYRYPVALAQAEVGGDPGADAQRALDRFHARAAHRVTAGRPGMTASTTHDTKRSEDTRARLAVLTERAAAFEQGFARWTSALRPPSHVTAVERRFVAQTVLGTWPLDTRALETYDKRIAAYLVKALREAKLASSWLDPDEGHEAAVVELAHRTTSDGGRVLHETFAELVDDVAWYGMINGLSQLTWKLGLPGTADIYRGCELWDLSLVDPDNRRPVDFGARIAMLERPDDGWRSGGLKLRMTTAGLRARRDDRALFTTGTYVPLSVAGAAALAFARRHEDGWALACAPRLPARLAPRDRWPVGRAVWEDRVVNLPADAPARWRDVYTDGEIEAAGSVLHLADMLTQLPAALLVSV